MVEIKGDGEVLTEGVGAQKEAASTPSTPTQCPQPTCRGKEICKLNQQAGMQLYQCGKCLHEWKVPLTAAERAIAVVKLAAMRPEELRAGELCAKGCGEEFRYPPEKKRHEAGCLGRRKPETGRKAEEKTVAKEQWKCESCTETFDSPWKRGAHARHAHGGMSKAKKVATSKPAVPAASKPTPGGAVAAAIATLEAKRAEIVAGIPELREVDAAIAALKGLGVPS